MFNSAEYAFSDISIVFAGKSIVGARGVKYAVKQDKELIYATGDKPHGIARGHKEYSGELRILQSEAEALISSVGAGKDICDIHGMDIIVVYAPKDSPKFTTDILKYVEFTEMAKDMKTGDKFQEISLPFICLGVDYNV